MIRLALIVSLLAVGACASPTAPSQPRFTTLTDSGFVPKHLPDSIALRPDSTGR